MERLGLDPPEHLSEATKTWWQRVNSNINQKPHQLLLLLLSCEAWDRSHIARDATEGNLGGIPSPALITVMVKR